MAKRLSIYFGILIAAVIIPALSLIIWAYTQINVSKSIITEQDFVAKAEALNAQVTATKLNVKTEDNKYSADEINNLVQKVVQKSLSAKNDSLDLLFIKCINNKVAYNFYLEEYNAKVAKKQQLAEESGNKQMRTSLNGKNFNYSEVYTNYGNYAFIRVENVYLGVVSFDDNVFREAVKTFGFEKPLNFEMG